MKRIAPESIVVVALMCGWLAFCANAGGAEARLAAKKQVLFVCTGNYYRSRFAEALFNEKAREVHLEWRAVSRGLRLVSSQQGISSFAQEELIKRGVPRELWAGAPQPLTAEDLANSDCIVLMDEAEHRPMLEKQFPTRDDRKIRYWHIGDSGKMKASKACQAMSRDIQELLATLDR